MGKLDKFKKKRDHLINDEIKSPSGKIRLVNTVDNTNKECSLKEGLEIAGNEGVDLVMISGGDVPVCKVVEYGKLMFQIEKGKKSNHANQSKSKVMKFSPRISDHDLEHKIKHIMEFLEDGTHVQIICQFQGRENYHKEFGHKIVQKIIDSTGSIGKIEVPLRDNGNNISITLCKK